MPDAKHPNPTHAEEAFTSLHGDDAFSASSGESEARRHLVELEVRPTGQPEPTPLSRSPVHMLRKIFSE